MIELLESTVYGAALVFGFRHGFDWDHIAALTDLTGSQPSGRRSMLLATLYALGHAAMVLLLGSVAIVFAARLPDSVDAAMERVVGVTLLALAAYILWSLVRYRGQPVYRSRWMVVLAGLRRLVTRRRERPPRPMVIEHAHPHDHDHALHRHEHPPAAGMANTWTGAATRVRHAHLHRHVSSMPADPFTTYSPWASFGIGALHGIGAETPTQVVVLAAALNTSGTIQSVGLLVCFAVGILAANTVVATASAFGFRHVMQRRAVYVSLSLLTAAVSVAVGALFLTGRSGSLPPSLGG